MKPRLEQGARRGRARRRDRRRVPARAHLLPEGRATPRRRATSSTPYFSDATGLTWKSRVQIAGIQVGEVVDIALAGAKARLDIRVKNGIELHTDACLTKTFPSALLPDALLEVQPGQRRRSRSSRRSRRTERSITCVREATSVQQLLDSLAKIAADVQLVTSDLAQTVAGDKGLREIVENLASATKRIDDDHRARTSRTSPTSSRTRATSPPTSARSPGATRTRSAASPRTSRSSPRSSR